MIAPSVALHRGIRSETSGAKLSIRPEMLHAGARVLDVGCGDGRHVAAAALRDCRTVGLDYDLDVLRDARSRLGSLPVDLIAGDAARLPFKTGVLDTVICTETLEHVPDAGAALSEIARVMRAGALLLGAVPSHFTELVYWRLSPRYAHAPGGHVRILSAHGIKRALAREGLRLEEMRYVHFVDSLLWLRFCLTDRLRPPRFRTPFEGAVALAEALQRPVPAWRTQLRRALPGSRLISAMDALGAFIWPKSLSFVARKGTRSAPARADRTQFATTA
jgi:SAM-dependent methyltransferase